MSYSSFYCDICEAKTTAVTLTKNGTRRCVKCYTPSLRNHREHKLALVMKSVFLQGEIDPPELDLSCILRNFWIASSNIDGGDTPEPNNEIPEQDQGLLKQIQLLTDAIANAGFKIVANLDGDTWSIIPVGSCSAKLQKSVPDLLRAAATTYEERNRLWGDNYKDFGAVMVALLPGGVELETADQWNRFGLFMHVMNKVTRYAQNINRGGNVDSAHDLSVYAAMLEELTRD